MKEPAAIVCLSAGGVALARRFAAALPAAPRIYGLTGRAEGADDTVDDLGAALRALYLEGRPLIGVCAAGVLVRALAPVIADKAGEPPVVAVAEDGGAVVSLLGGHRGANALAEIIAGALGVAAAITTAGDRRFGIALDAPPEGYRLANPEHYKGFTARLLGGARVRLEGEAQWLRESGLPFAEAGPLAIRVTERAVAGAPDHLVYHPLRLALGVGCERGVAPEALVALVEETLAGAGLAAGAVAGVFSIDLKADEPAVHALAERLSVPARFFSAAELDAERGRLATPSAAVHREVGCHGVAEGAALAAAGPEGELVVAKRKGQRTTCALAMAPAPLLAGRAGRPRGRLTVVGLGPGCEGWRTPEASRALAAASDVVGYRGYLELAGRLLEGKRRHPFALGEERERVEGALGLAAGGCEVALVSSGDPGIYAMAALVFEVLEAAGRADWRRVEVRVAPGVSALQAAAARAGAPLGHDFCAVSLSDLLTPWAIIEARLRAAAEGDFVVALYNPASARRRRALAAAARILAARRAPSTPVVIARNLGRPGESVRVITLDALVREQVDMLTLVLVGSSETRVTGHGRVYTPRGYRVGAAGPEHGGVRSTQG